MRNEPDLVFEKSELMRNVGISSLLGGYAMLLGRNIKLKSLVNSQG